MSYSVFFPLSLFLSFFIAETRFLLSHDGCPLSHVTSRFLCDVSFLFLQFLPSTIHQVRICHALLEQPDVEVALRVGDCYALLVEFYVGQKNFEAAYKLLQDMRTRQIVLNPYLEEHMIAEIHSQVGAGPAAEGGGGGGGGGSGSGGGKGGGGGAGRGADEDEEEEEEMGEELNEEVDEVDSDGEGQFRGGK